MFIGATGFNISNIAGVLYGDVPLNLTVNQQVCMAYTSFNLCIALLPL